MTVYGPNYIGNNMVETVMTRQVMSRASLKEFALRTSSPSSGLVMKTQLQRTLDDHRGCVNTVAFTPGGDQLISGSDDLRIVIWDWQRGEVVTAWESGHNNNVFQARQIGIGGQAVVSSAADGQVRLHLLKPSGYIRSRKIGGHEGLKCHKISIDPHQPHCLYSAGEDGSVRHYDIRLSKAGSQKVLVAHSAVPSRRGHVMELYGIATDPARQHTFAVCGDEEYVAVYDARRLPHRCAAAAPAHVADGALSSEPVGHLCPRRLRGRGRYPRAHVTAVDYSRRGELLATYNDDDIYLFRPSALDARDAEAGTQRMEVASQPADPPQSRRCRPSSSGGAAASSKRARQHFGGGRAAALEAGAWDGEPQPVATGAANVCAPPGPSLEAVAVEGSNADSEHGGGGQDASPPRGRVEGDSAAEAQEEEEEEDDDDEDEDDEEEEDEDDNEEEEVEEEEEEDVFGEGMSPMLSFPLALFARRSRRQRRRQASPPPEAPDELPCAHALDGHFAEVPSRSWLCAGPDAVAQRFRGHRNQRTYKGVTFLGLDDEYVASGSDCGHLFVWSKRDGVLRRMLHGDSQVLNCVAPHPTRPFTIATSGIDSDVKIWEPVENAAWRAESASQLQSTLRNNRKRPASLGVFGEEPSFVQLMLLRHISAQMAAFRDGEDGDADSSGAE